MEKLNTEQELEIALEHLCEAIKPFSNKVKFNKIIKDNEALLGIHNIVAAQSYITKVIKYEQEQLRQMAEELENA